MPPGKESQGPLAGSEKSGLTSHEPETFENGGQQTLRLTIDVGSDSVEGHAQEPEPL